jgi:hypothetical protein
MAHGDLLKILYPSTIDMLMDNIKDIVKRNKSWSGVVRELELDVTGWNIQATKKLVANTGIDTSHFVGRNHERKYTSDILKEAVKDSVSYADLCRRLGIKATGGNVSHLKKRIKEYNLDTSHFMDRKTISRKAVEQHNQNKKKTAEEILIERESGNRRNAYHLRRSLLEMGREYKCEADGCNVNGSWAGNPITLQIHHINGNVLDDRVENLKFLCPNCHSQTDNWCNAKRSN